MSSSKMTLLGLYNHNSHIFDGLQFPAGIDRQMAIDEILMRSGEFEILYPDMAFLTDAITHWGRKHFRTFEQWIRALSIEFDPLYNYDRFEEYTDAKTAQGQQTSGSTSKGQTSSADVESTRTDASSSGSDEKTSQSISSTDSQSETTDGKTRKVSAYDEATYQNREKEDTTSNSEGGGNGFAANRDEAHSAGTDSSQGDTVRTGHTGAESSHETVASSNQVEQTKHTAHLYGNIGVTTSTQMLEDFLRVERFTIYEQIADIFVDEFCILIY